METKQQLKDMQKEVLRYKRSDGVDLTGTLYLPPGYDAARDGPLPTILWAYPREYKSKVRLHVLQPNMCSTPAAAAAAGGGTNGWALMQNAFQLLLSFSCWLLPAQRPAVQIGPKYDRAQVY
jgi:hypothetical protein